MLGKIDMQRLALGKLRWLDEHVHRREDSWGTSPYHNCPVPSIRILILELLSNSYGATFSFRREVA